MAKSILVVEDDRDQRALIQLYLENAGYTVRSVSNGLEAAASCLSATPDLIVSDVRMPHMNGFEMIRILKSEPAMRDIPVIFLTVDRDGHEQASDLGAVDYLTKPFKHADLLKSVAKYFPAA